MYYFTNLKLSLINLNRCCPKLFGSAVVIIIRGLLYGVWKSASSVPCSCYLIEALFSLTDSQLGISSDGNTSDNSMVSTILVTGESVSYLWNNDYREPA